jgi:hypothetical protein
LWYNTHMKKTIHLPSKLSRLLNAIEDDGRGLSWMPYRDACADYSAHGLDMPDSLASYHMSAIASRWKQEGCELPISL